MKKLTKKNNKGFSLVELIVVVLIMAIIAVALAPQVTKWVQNSRQATDAQLNDSLISGLQLLAATKQSYQSGTYTVEVSTSGVAFKKSGTADATFESDLKGIYAGADTKSRTFTFEVKLDGGKVTSNFSSNTMSGDFNQ